MQFKPVPEENWESTSYHFQNLKKCSPQQITKVLGEPDLRDTPNDMDKTQWEWERIMVHEGESIQFSIYDWKNYNRTVKETDTWAEWHIGATTEKNAKLIAKLLNPLL